MDAQQLSTLKLTAIVNTLQSCRIFAGLPTRDLQSIAVITVVKRLGKGDYLFREGEPSVGFYVVQRGTINVHRTGSGGKEQVIHLFRAGDSFAEVTLVPDTAYPADARALEPSQVLLVQQRDFLALVRRHPELALRMLASMSRHLRLLVDLLDDLTLKDVETRFAGWLLKRCPDPTGDAPVAVTLPTTKRLLASELGTVSETLSRTLAKFRHRRLISTKGRVLTVLRPAQLLALLQERELG